MARTDAAALWAGAEVEAVVARLGRRLRRRAAHRPAGAYLRGPLGLGTAHAGQLLVSAGQNLTRLRSEAAFAHPCATDPIPASSGRTARHRLDPGGDRAANAARPLIAIVRRRSCAPTRPYAAR